MILTRAQIASVIAALSLTACGSATDEPRDTSSSTPPPPAEATPVTPAEPMSDRCKDDVGDGGPVDLKSVRVTLADSLSVDVKVVAPLPKTDTAMVGINVSSEDGEMARQLAVKWVDGEAPGPFVFDMDSAEQENLPASAFKVDGKTITIDFPIGTVSDLGDKWKWSAFSNAAGDDVDACPGKILSFKTRTFPSA